MRLKRKIIKKGNGIQMNAFFEKKIHKVSVWDLWIHIICSKWEMLETEVKMTENLTST